jgi:hypothetical protein
LGDGATERARKDVSRRTNVIETSVGPGSTQKGDDRSTAVERAGGGVEASPVIDPSLPSEAAADVSR